MTTNKYKTNWLDYAKYLVNELCFVSDPRSKARCKVALEMLLEDVAEQKGGIVDLTEDQLNAGNLFVGIRPDDKEILIAVDKTCKQLEDIKEELKK